MAKSVKAAAEANSNTGPSFDTFFQHYREISVALTKKAEADSVLQHAYKRAKAAGINLAAIKFAMKSKRRDFDEVAADVRATAQYMAWLDMPIGTQADMFATAPLPDKGAEALREADAEQAGYDSGLRGGTPADCPHRVGTAVHAAWVRGVHRGQEFMGQRAPTVVQVEPRKPGVRKGGGVKQAASVAIRKGNGRRGTKGLPPEVPEVSPAQSAQDDGPVHDDDDWDRAAPEALH